MRFQAVIIALATLVGAGLGAAVEYISTPWRGIGAGVGGAALAYGGALVAERLRRRRARGLAWRNAFASGPPVGGRPGSHISLLEPGLQTVPFDRRRSVEIARITTWLRAEESGRVWRIDGGPGTGKTRLVVQLAAGLKSSSWEVVWSRPGRASVAIAAAVDRGRPVLIIVDDANDDREGVAALLTALAEVDGTVPVRVLLLARDDDQWWADVVNHRGWRIEELSEASTRLGPLGSDLADQAQVFRRAVVIFARDSGIPAPPVQLAGLTAATPVMLLHTAALVAVQRALSRKDRLAEINVSDAMEELIAVEDRTYWQPTSERLAARVPMTERQRRSAVAVAALVGASSGAEAIELVRALSAFGQLRKGEAGQVAGWLRRLYPAVSEDSLRPHLPGWAAEYLVASTLVSVSESATATSDLIGKSSDRCREVLGALAKPTSYIPAARTAYAALVAADPLGRLDVACATALVLTPWVDQHLALVVAEAPNGHTAFERAMKVVPVNTVSLQLTAVALARRLVAGAPKSRDRAAALTELSWRLIAVGEFDEAMPISVEAVDAWRELADKKRSGESIRSADAVGLGRALAARAAGVGTAGDSAAALEHFDEAIKLFTPFSAEVPHELGRCLVNRGTLLDRLDRRPEAAEAYTEAVAYFRALSTADEDADRFGLARALAGLAWLRAAQEERERAEEAFAEALRILRDVISRRPDAYIPELVRTLGGYLRLEWQSGDLSAAVQATREAVAACRQLSSTHPNRFRPWLMEQLENLWRLLSATEQPGETLTILREIVGLQRALAAAMPDNYQVSRIQWVNTLSARLSEAGDFAEATAFAEESVVAFRELVEMQPRFRPGLVHALNKLIGLLPKLDRYEERPALAQEQVAVLRSLVDDGNDDYKSRLALALSTTGQTFWDLNDPSALGYDREAVKIWREIVDQTGRGRNKLARALNGLGASLQDLGLAEELLEVDRETVEIWRELVAEPDPPAAYRVGLATALDGLGISLTNKYETTESADVHAEAVDIMRELYTTDAGRYRDDLAHMLSNFAAALTWVEGRDDESAAAAEESVALARKMVELENSSENQEQLAQSLEILGLAVAKIGRPREGYDALRESLALMRSLAASFPERSWRRLGVTVAHLGQAEAKLQLYPAAARHLEEGLQYQRENLQPSRLTNLVECHNSLQVLVLCRRRLDDLPAAFRTAQEDVDICRLIAGATSSYAPVLEASETTLREIRAEMDRRAA